ncbi:MAG: PilZ domain-containing protein [Thermodesulfobacteriota bacterium]
MDMRICPDCKKAFYFFKNQKPYSCTHCGYFFVDKRQHKRIEKKAGCVFVLDGIKHEGVTKDYSFGGACVEYAGEAIAEDAFLDFESNMLGLHVPAKAVWFVSRPSKGILMGLKFLSTEEGA